MPHYVGVKKEPKRARTIITNKDVIQSYIVTSAKYDFTVYEKRVLYRIVELLQGQLEGKKLQGKYSLNKNLFNDATITMPLDAFLNGEKDNNYDQVRDAFKRLESKSFEFDDGNVWAVIRLVHLVKIERYSSFAKFTLASEIYSALLDFSKGFNKFELVTAMSFESAYSMRLYELLSGQKKPITYTIDHLKIMFQVQEKYKETKDFIRYIIDSPKRELDKKSPYSFEYKINKLGKKFHSITFYPVYQPKNRDPKLEQIQLQKQVNLSWDMDKMTRDYLMENYFFTADEIKRNIDVFKLADKHCDLLLELSKFKAKSEKIKNIKGYIINALKKCLWRRVFCSLSPKTPS